MSITSIHKSIKLEVNQTLFHILMNKLAHACGGMVLNKERNQLLTHGASVEKSTGPHAE